MMKGGVIMAFVQVVCPVCGKNLGQCNDKASCTTKHCSGCGKNIVIQYGQTAGWR